MACKQNYKGFTLIEIVVVVSIISLLSAIGLTMYVEQQKNSRDAKRKSDLTLISGILQNYYSVNKVYPDTIKNDQSNSYVFYFSNFKKDSTDKNVSITNVANANNTCTDRTDSAIFINDSRDGWIPNLIQGGYISNLPTDPTQQSLGTRNCQSSAEKVNKWFDNKGQVYFYSARQNSLAAGGTVSDKTGKFYILGAFLENKDDTATIGKTQQNIFGSTFYKDSRFWDPRSYIITSQ